MLRKTLYSSLLLLVSLISSTYLTYAAGSSASTPILSHPNSDVNLVRISILVHPDGTWEGEAYLPGVLPSPLTLDAQVQREAAAILGDRGTLTAWEKVAYAPPGAEGVAHYALSIAGPDAREIVDVVLDASRAVERFEGPVALELSGAVREGQALALNLPGNPSTGYAWTVAIADEHSLTQVGTVETHQASQVPNRLGAPATYVVQLRATRTGQSDLRLVYQRPWQSDLAPTVVLSVQTDDGDLASTCSALSVPLASLALDRDAESPGENSETGRQDSTILQDASAESVPSAYNWCDTHGGCPSVRDQGACGSCWAFATAGPLEAWVKYRDGAGSVDLAEQYLVSCNTDNWGCDGGWWAHDYHQGKKPPSEAQAGAVLESASPYQASETPCSGPYSPPYKISAWHYAENSYAVASTQAIKQAIYDHGPVAVAICTGSSFQRYSGGVFQTDESWRCGEGKVNHAVVLVGWDDADQAWVMRNSWGPGWGEGGYMRIRYGTSNVGFGANYITYTPFTASNWIYLPLITQEIGGTPSSSLSNGDFENGSDGAWSESSTSGWSLIYNVSSLPVDAHGGSWAAWLGGSNDETSVLSQQVTIPSDATTLNYWYWSASEDLCGYDYAYVRLDSSTLQAYDLCEDTSTGAWTSQQINVTAWRGQTVQLSFTAETDGSLNSNFFLDDVSISTGATSPVPSVSSDAPPAPPPGASRPKQSP